MSACYCICTEYSLFEAEVSSAEVSSFFVVLCSQKSSSCGPLCNNGGCIPMHKVYDGNVDCLISQDDESNETRLMMAALQFVDGEVSNQRVTICVSQTNNHSSGIARKQGFCCLSHATGLKDENLVGALLIVSFVILLCFYDLTLILYTSAFWHNHHESLIYFGIDNIIETKSSCDMFLLQVTGLVTGMRPPSH